MILISKVTHLIKERFFIIQYNAHRSKNSVMTTFLKNFKMLKYDIIALQESWRNNFQTITHFSNNRWFNLIYADQTDIKNMKFRVCFYINKRIDQFKIKIHFDFRDVFIIEIQLKNSKLNLTYSLWLHNVYNELNITSTPALIKFRKILKNRRVNNASTNDFNKNIIIKNLNIHHFQWEDFEVRFDGRSHELLNIINEFKFIQHVFRETRTYISDTYDTP